MKDNLHGHKLVKTSSVSEHKMNSDLEIVNTE